MKEVNKFGFSGEIPQELYEEEKWSKLTEPEVEKGNKRLKFKHPLAEMPLWQVFPFLKRVYCCKSEHTDSEQSLKEKAGQKLNKSSVGHSSKKQRKNFRQKQKDLRNALKQGEDKEEAFKRVIGQYYDKQVEERDEDEANDVSDNNISVTGGDVATAGAHSDDESGEDDLFALYDQLNAD